MTMPNGMREATPPPANTTPPGRKPRLLTDEKVKVLLSSPNVWYIIGTAPKWLGGNKSNIVSMTQRNIAHLADKGKFEIQQRKNKNDEIDIYCRYVPNHLEQEGNNYE